MDRRKTEYRVVLATRNRHKILEIESIIGDLVTIETSAGALGIEIPECGRSLLENSLAKATFIYRLRGMPALADDSGLFVEALDGAPGIYSARYGRNDPERIARLLDELAGAENRRAAFRAVFVYYHAPGAYESFEGVCPGRIALQPRGAHGFGYDPVFVPDGHDQTFAEMDGAMKNRISHRARALAGFRAYLLRGVP